MAYQSARAARNSKYAVNRTQTTRMAAVSMDGMDELQKFLDHIIDQKTRMKIMSGAIRAGLTEIKRVMRKLVNKVPVNTPRGDDVRRAARQTLGTYFKRFPRKGGYTAKAGFGVGMRGGKRTECLTMGSSPSPGSVGIAGSNIHWWVLGTSQRTTKTGKRLGKINPIFKGVVRQAQVQASSTVVPKMLKRAKATFKRIAIKNKRRVVG
jgi:hypothetical protein